MASGVDTLISPAMEEAKGKWGEPTGGPPTGQAADRGWTSRG